MFKTHEISIGPILRWLLGVLGFIACIGGSVLFLDDLQQVLSGDFLRAPIAVVMLIVIAGGVSLLRSAIRGRLMVRSYGRKY